MRPRSKSVAVAAGISSLFAAAVLAQGPGVARNANPAGDNVVIGGHLDVIQRSDVSSLREGVIEEIERHPGHEVKKGDHLGSLFDKTAELNLAKTQVQAANTGAIAKGEAQQSQALADLARSKRLNEINPGSVSREQVDKQVADTKFAAAIIQEAKENQAVNQAEAAIAKQILEEHKIKAPIDGMIIEVLKHPGEKVGANEPVLRIVDINKLRFRGFVPIDVAYRLRPNDTVQIRPTIEGADLPIERMTFPAKITFIAPQVQTVVKNEVEIHAELENPRDPETKEHLLRDGLKADMTITIGRAANAVGAR